MFVKDKTADEIHFMVADEDGIGKDEPIAEGIVTVDFLMKGDGEGKVSWKSKPAGKVSWSFKSFEPMPMEELEKCIAEKAAPATNQNKKKNKKNRK